MVKSGFQNTTKAQQTSKPTKLSTAKLSTISHRRVLSRRQCSPNGRRRKAQHQSRIGQHCCRSYTTQPKYILATRALTSDWWERKAVELQRAANRNNTKGYYNGLKEVWGPKKKGPVHLKYGMETFSNSKTFVARSYSTSLATYITKLCTTSRSAFSRHALVRFHPWMRWLAQSPA